MRTFAPKQNRPQNQVSSSLAPSNKSASGPNHHAHPVPHLQRTIGNQAEQRLLQVNPEGLEVESGTTATTRFAHDFSRIPVHAIVPVKAQTKLTINTPGDLYEQEADRVADQVMRMPEPKLQRACACGGECPKCQREHLAQGQVHLKTMYVGSNDPGQTVVPPIIHETLRSPGQPLDTITRAFFEPRLGWDFSRVRIHADAQAAQSTKSINARAYTIGNEIVFGSSEYQPTTTQGRRLLAHELAHVVQQDSMIHRLQRQEDGTSTQQPATGGQSTVGLTASGDQCQDCLNACEAGGDTFLDFCRSLSNPALRAGCFALTYAGTVACKGWCYWHFCD